MKQPPTYSDLLWASDRIDPAKYEFNLFCDQSTMIQKSSYPVHFWRATEFYPSYLLIQTPYIVPGQMPIDLPWLYAWLTILDQESREEGFLVTNLVNEIPPKHLTVGTAITREPDARALKRYYLVRQEVKTRIEAFWNSVTAWHPLYTRMKEISWQLLTDPFQPTPRKIVAAIQAYESVVDRFFAPIVAPETMYEFFARWMVEIDTNERTFELF